VTPKKHRALQPIFVLLKYGFHEPTAIDRRCQRRRRADDRRANAAS